MMRKLHVQFTEKNLTGNAGLIHLGRFAEKLGLDKMLTRRITIKRAENAQYEAAHIVMLLVMGALAGAKHLSHLVILKSDNALRALFRWDSTWASFHLPSISATSSDSLKRDRHTPRFAQTRRTGKPSTCRQVTSWGESR